jgi:hypothetical protein
MTRRVWIKPSGRGKYMKPADYRKLVIFVKKFSSMEQKRILHRKSCCQCRWKGRPPSAVTNMVKKSDMMKPISEFEHEIYVKSHWVEQKICSEDLPSLSQFLTNSISEHFFTNFTGYQKCFTQPHFVLSGAGGGMKINLECRKCQTCVASF